MNYITGYLILMSVFLISACGGRTPINELALPPVTLIEGKVSQLDESGFLLEDDSGLIYVRADLPENQKPGISEGERISVYGNLQAIRTTFDAYVIKNASGEQIIITNPGPHIGFILQTSFDEK